MRTTGFVEGGPRLILRAEGTAVLAAAIVAYASLHAGWGLFALLFLAPDLAFAAYLASRAAGTAAYNAAHSYVVPVALGLAAHAFGWPAALAVAVIWIAHIGFDRMIGYGLKYGTAFSDTHLGRVGRPR